MVFWPILLFVPVFSGDRFLWRNKRTYFTYIAGLIPIRGHSKTMLTNFCPILTTYLPFVDNHGCLTDHLPITSSCPLSFRMASYGTFRYVSKYLIKDLSTSQSASWKVFISDHVMGKTPPHAWNSVRVFWKLFTGLFKDYWSLYNFSLSS